MSRTKSRSNKMGRTCKCKGKRHSVTCKKNKTIKNKKGGGYGGNPFCNDPNFSIFNTNLLKLFPYNPVK